MTAKAVQSIFLITVLISCWASLAFSFERQLNDMQNIDELRSKILTSSVIGRICDEDAIVKSAARKKRMQIASEHDTRFEDHKLRLRQLGDDLVMLNDLKQNLKNIKHWERRKKEINGNFDQKIRLYLNNNSDIYIPVVYASFVELPINRRHLKYQLMQSKLFTELVEGYGIEKIFSKTARQVQTSISQKGVKAEKCFHEFIRTRQGGAVEQDGTRNFEFRDLVYRTPKTTKCLTVGFYRFKPFARPTNLPGDQAEKSRAAIRRPSFDFRYDSWNLADPESVNELKAHIQKEFEQHEVFVRHLEKYLKFLGDISKEMDEARRRITYIVKRITEMQNERKSRVEMADMNIRRLKNINENLMDRLDLSSPVAPETIDQMIANKKRRKKALEKDFQYRFVLMAQSPETRLETAIRNSLEAIFDELEVMLKKQTLTIETVIADGVLEDVDETLTTYTPDFKRIHIQHYLAGQNAGAIVVLDVKYGRKDAADVQHQQQPFYIENAEGLNLKMIQLSGKKDGVDPFYISASEITKAQYFNYLKSKNINKSSYFKDNCRWMLADYPDTYPMLQRCIPSKSEIKGFLRWLNKNTNQPYRYMLPSEKQHRLAISRGIKPGKSGFRVISR